MNFDTWYTTKINHIEEVLFEEGEIKTAVTFLIESIAKEAWNRGYEKHLLEMTEAMEQLGITEKETFDDEDTFGYDYYR
jgi:hypothetical protein